MTKETFPHAFNRGVKINPLKAVIKESFSHANGAAEALLFLSEIVLENGDLETDIAKRIDACRVSSIIRQAFDKVSV